jgi:hypothetical protein
MAEGNKESHSEFLRKSSGKCAFANLRQKYDYLTNKY